MGRTSNARPSADADVKFTTLANSDVEEYVILIKSSDADADDVVKKYCSDNCGCGFLTRHNKGLVNVLYENNVGNSTSNKNIINLLNMSKCINSSFYT